MGTKKSWWCHLTEMWSGDQPVWFNSDLCVSRREGCDVTNINKWVATSAQGVTHSREAVLSPLMTINVNRTISAHLLKCLTVDGLLADRSSILIRRLIQAQGGWRSFSLSKNLIFLLFSLFVLFFSIDRNRPGENKIAKLMNRYLCVLLLC